MTVLPFKEPLRILILNPDLPIFPGRAMHEYLNTIGLRQLGHQVGLVSAVHTQRQADALDSLRRYDIDMYLWWSPFVNMSPKDRAPQEPPGWRQRFKVMWHWWRDWLRPTDTKFADLTFRNLAEPLYQALLAHPWDVLIVIQSVHAHWIDYLPEFPLRVLVFHDVRSRIYEQRAGLAQSLWARWIERLETWRYRHFERKYAQRYELAITVSSVDEAYARAHFRPNRLVTVPIPVDPEYFQPLTAFQEVPGRIMFTGTMNHPPNVDAALYFAHEVFPKIRQLWPQAEFWIVGRDPAPEVQNLSNLPGIVVTGFVEDIRHYIATAEVIVVPLRYGAGMRNKILEAWGMEKCIVSTSLGAEGLAYEEGKHLLIADNRDTMVTQILRIFNDPRLKENLKRHGREIILKQHHPTHIAHRYQNAIREAFQAHYPHYVRNRKVVLDLHWMYPGLAGGIESLARSFLKELIALDRETEYMLLGPQILRYTLDLRYAPNFSFFPLERRYAVDRLFELSRRLAGRLKWPYWQTPEVRRLRTLRALKGAVSFSISGYIHPILRPLRNVLLVPDIQHEYHPEFFSPEQLAERRKIYQDAVQQAMHIGAISEFTRRSLIERYHVPPDKITTLYLAADPIYHARTYSPQQEQRVLQKYQLPPGEYLFYPANTWPHKNHLTLLQALVILRERYRMRPLLVCTGASKESHEELLRFVATHHLEKQVRFLGYLPLEELPILYANAMLMTYPSLFEGFGMPILEAMWSGAPVIASNVTSIPEVAGEAALLLPPKAPESWAEHIYLLATRSDLRNELRQRGFRQARKFSWRRFTVQVLQIFKRVYEQ